MKLFIFLFLICLNAQAWGPIGHRIVGKIAQEHLAPSTEKKVKKILQNANLSDVAIWADFIRSDPSWNKAAPWHYISIDKWPPKNRSNKGDVLWAIEKFSQDIKKNQNPQEALKFLVHFIGDLHQPLHIGKSKDKGGNTIKLKWFGEHTNLHWIWDDKLIKMEDLSFTEYVKHLGKIPPKEAKQWQSGSPQDWAKESYQYRELVYSYPKKAKKGWEFKYYFKTRDVLQLRLKQAGVRLAKVLNEILP